jgi:uncharacterized protein
MSNVVDLSNWKLVTHKDCPDGSTCAMLFVAAGGKRENIVFTNPGHEETDEVAYDLFETWAGPILFADVSVSEDCAKKLDNRFDIVLLDHHKSAEPLKYFSFALVDMTRCGCRLVYEWLILNQLGNVASKYKDLVMLVDDRDRWVNKLEDSKDISHGLHTIYGQEQFINRFLKNPIPALTPEERFCLDLDRAKEKAFVEKKKRQVVVYDKVHGNGTIRVGFVMAGGPYRSELGNAIVSDPVLDVDVAVMVSGDSISMRSRKNGADVALIGAVNGGGGHAAAAGCSVPGVLGKGLLDLVVENMKFA